MNGVVILAALSAVVSWGVAVWVLHSAQTIGLIQEPDHRSSHVQSTPGGGGLGIVLAGSMAGLFLTWWLAWDMGTPLVLFSSLIAAVGLRDDIQHVPARVRLLVQFAVCLGLLFALGKLPEMPLSLAPGLAGPTVDGWMFSGLLLLAGIWWINLFNFMDGIDGLASSQAIFMLLSGAALALWSEPTLIGNAAWIWGVCVASAVVGFLLLNFPPAKMFMGDVGSTYLGFMILALALIGIQAGWLNYAVWLVLAAVFVTDATVTMFIRIVRRERWYEAHCSHAYQRLSRRWSGERHVGHRLVTQLISVINLLWLAPLAWACVRYSEYAAAFVALAYIPLIIGTLFLGAGRTTSV